MNWFVIISVIALSLSLNAQNITWDEERKLTWADFKAKPEDNRFAASTYCVIGMFPIHTNILNGQTTYNITCEFIPDSSWYFIDKGTREVLIHEQLHFDIAELYARKMRQKLKRPVMPKVGKYIFDTLYNEYIDFQELYERQTKFGSIREEQIRWESMVKRQLRKLRKFAVKNE